MPILTREQILSAQDLGLLEVDVPEWGGTVKIKPLTSQERDAFEMQFGGSKKNKSKAYVNIRAKLLVKCIVDEKGQTIFMETDIEELGKKSAAATDRVFERAMSMAGLGEDDIKEMEKNL